MPFAFFQQLCIWTDILWYFRRGASKGLIFWKCHYPVNLLFNLSIIGNVNDQSKLSFKHWEKNDEIFSIDNRYKIKRHFSLRNYCQRRRDNQPSLIVAVALTIKTEPASSQDFLTANKNLLGTPYRTLHAAKNPLGAPCRTLHATKNSFGASCETLLAAKNPSAASCKILIAGKNPLGTSDRTLLATKNPFGASCKTLIPTKNPLETSCKTRWRLKIHSERHAGPCSWVKIHW